MEERKYQFEKLTPIDNVDLDVYEEAIDYVFENSDIKNVAISGAYSAGKSSLLASYKKKHNNLHFLHISLAHFKSPNQENETEVKESVLEGKILNQLIHQIPSEKIPQTNFRVKKKINAKSVTRLTIRATLFFIAIIFFARFDAWKSYVTTLPDNDFKSILTLSVHQYALIVDGLLIVALLSSLIYELIEIQKNKNIFRKLNLKGNEIEIFEESEDSYFDKYLNEVLYLFENVDADVIVFEDMDRFNANKIFERLREVNTLANIQLQKESKKVLRFFYLLRDDIFVSKDRTKFFDYIIPVVPVVDGSNSYDQFISHLKKGGIFEKFSETFLQGLSLYIDDMRLLKNICNEFIIYYNRLNITELDCNKMLAIIAYKNLFPRDFANLQLNQGFVYTLFDRKDFFVAEETKELKEQISKRVHEIELARSEHLKTVKELDTVYKRTDRYGHNIRLSEEEEAERLERKKAIDNKLNNRIPAIEDEIKILENDIIALNNKQLRDIITRENIDHIFSIKSVNAIGSETEINEVKSSEYFDLLKYLIRNGYIDETYADYMTYFYENSLNRIDKIFLRSITDKNAKEYTYKLKNPQLVVSRLRLVDFDQEEALNFDLFTYLLQNSRIDYVNRIIDQLRNTKNFNFVGSYLDTTPELLSYIEHLNMRWPEAFITALNEQSLTEKQIRKYSISTLYYSNDDVIRSVNKDNCLCNYISNSRDYLAIDNPNTDRLIHCFTLLGVCFIGFNYTELNKGLFDAAYEGSLYEINAENLQLIQREILGEKDEDSILHKNYTILCSHPDAPITQYVNQNINKYFSVLFQICGGPIHDDENVVVSVLNNDNLTDEYKRDYIANLKTTISSIKKIYNNSFWSLLLNVDIVQYSEYNVMECCNAINLNESVISYINRCNIDLDFSKAEYDQKAKEKLFNSVIICNDIENAKYKQILVSLGITCDNFTITEISDDKLAILIDAKVIRMTANNLQFMRENYPNRSLYFIHRNMEKYVDIMEENPLSQEELLEILSWDISDEQRIRLIEFTDEEISVIGKNYSPALCLHILNNNFMKSDLENLFSSFEQWDVSVQTAIFNIATQNIEFIIDNPKLVSEKLKKNLFHSERVSRDVKIDLLIAIISDISENNIKDTLALLNLTDYLKIYDIRSRPKFEVNDENEKLLAAFKEANIIDNYEESSGKRGYYKISRVKPTTKKD